MKIVQKIGNFTTATIILVFIIAFCVTGTVMSQSQNSVLQNEAYDRTLEREYVSQVRHYLEEEGFQNSGVALTKVMDRDGSRTYTMTIHHRKIDRLTDNEQEQLKQKLKTVIFPVQDSELCHEFLITEL